MSGPVKTLEAAAARFANVLLVAAAGAALTMTALVVLASVMRYVVGSPFHFTEELVALLYAAMMFLTIPLCTIKNQHIGMTVVVQRLGAPGKRILRLLSCMVTLIFAVCFIVESYKFTAFGRELGSRTEQVDFLLWPWMAIMPATMAFVAVIVAIQTVQAWTAIRRGEAPVVSTEPERDPF